MYLIKTESLEDLTLAVVANDLALVKCSPPKKPSDHPNDVNKEKKNKKPDPSATGGFYHLSDIKPGSGSAVVGPHCIDLVDMTSFFLNALSHGDALIAGPHPPGACGNYPPL